MDKNNSNMMKWYLAAGKDGKDGKIITNEEAKSLSPGQREGHLYTLSAALRDGLIAADLSQNEDVNELTFWSAPNKDQFGRPIESNRPKKYLTNIEDRPTEKIGNALRDKLQEMKQQSTENSLKAQIEAKKKQLQTNKE